MVEVKAIQDNITLIGPLEEIFGRDGEIKAYEFIIKAIEDIGCKLNPEKFQLFSIAHHEMIKELVPENFQVPFITDDSDVKHYGMVLID